MRNSAHRTICHPPIEHDSRSWRCWLPSRHRGRVVHGPGHVHSSTSTGKPSAVSQHEPPTLFLSPRTQSRVCSSSAAIICGGPRQTAGARSIAVIVKNVTAAQAHRSDRLIIPSPRQQCYPKGITCRPAMSVRHVTAGAGAGTLVPPQPLEPDR
jgi:hypothetical protein